MFNKLNELYVTLYFKTIDTLDNLNEVFLASVITLITAVVTYFAYQYGDSNLQEMSNRGLRLSAFILYSVGLIKYLGTQKLDILKEILEDQNIALAIVLSALILGGAGCILL